MTNTKQFIHIGHPKTASTWLQKNLFSNEKHFNYYSLHEHRSPKKMHKSFAAWMHAVRFLDAAGLETYQKHHEDIEAWINAIPKNSKALMISDEGLCASTNRDLACARLKEKFPNAQIILIIRSQTDLIRSMYLQFARGFGSKTYSFTFEDYIEKCIATMSDPKSKKSKNPNPHIIIKNPIAQLDYQALVEIYEKHFPKKQINIFLYERLFDENKTDLKKLMKLLGIENLEAKKDAQKTHARMSKNAYLKCFYQGSKNPFLNIISNVFRILTVLEKSGILTPQKVNLTMSRKHKKQFETFFANENAKLSRRYKLNLDAHGYPFKDK